MTDRTAIPAIDRLIAALAPVTEQRGFLAAGLPEWTGRLHVFEWSRTTWKHDALRLLWRPSVMAIVLIEATWSIPRPGAAGADGYRRIEAYVREHAR